MTVLLSDGTKLGRVVRTSGERLEVERGYLFRKRYWVRFDDIDRESEGKLHLRLSRDGLSVNEPGPFEPLAPAGSSSVGDRSPLRLL
jgi:hypothetical protein